MITRSKPFDISKKLVWEAWLKVKKNGGSYGIDKQSIDDFELNIKDNLYKLWNRLSSGSYFPPAVKRVNIPKSDGGIRPLGIPTVGDRVAQMAMKMLLEPELEPVFHPNSFGYRPGKSAIEAVGTARKNCWRYPWVLDLDIKGFFDSINHELMMKAVKFHSSNKWISLYIERWLKAPICKEDGTLVSPIAGTPQGGVISPLLANLYLHYSFDKWFEKRFPELTFERYADDIVIHCKSKCSTELVKKVVENRLKECCLELHPEKTKIVFCKSSKLRGNYSQVTFDFLGFQFRPRKAMNKQGEVFTGFLPAISPKSKNKISATIRNWKIQKWSVYNEFEVAKALNPIIRGWINYYGSYTKSAIFYLQDKLNYALLRWLRKKYKRLKGWKKAKQYIRKLAKQFPRLFAHWCLLSSQGFNSGSRMS